jgi:DNA-damage-inducible protein J
LEALVTKTATITVRLDPLVKQNAEEVLRTLGLTITQAVSLFFTQISLNKGLPFAVEVPNAETSKAMEDIAMHRDVKTFESVDALFAELGS